MSQDEWDNLQPGMIVVERRSRTPRLVLAVHRRPWKCKPTVNRRRREWVGVELFKLRSGGYPCPTTTLYPWDWLTRLDVAHGKRGTVRREFFYCECHGWSHIAKGGAWVDPAYAATHRNMRTGCKLSDDSHLPVPRPDWKLMPWVRP